MTPADHTTALLAGATGLIGREIARQWPTLMPEPGTLHQLVRRAGSAASGPRLAERVVDFKQIGTLPRATLAFCALGTTIKVAGSQAAFRAVDFDAVLAFARAARAAGVHSLAVVSALGADASSSTFYNRVKGEMEAAVAELGFARLVIARPSLLAGNREALQQAPRPGEALALAVTRPLAGLMPLAWRPIAASTVATALIRALLVNTVAEAASGQAVTPGPQVLSSAQLQRLGR